MSTETRLPEFDASVGLHGETCLSYTQVRTTTTTVLGVVKDSLLLRVISWIPPSRKKCLWLDGSSSWTSRSRKRSVRWIRWKLRIEICPNSFSIFKRCFSTQANRCKTPKRNWPSYEVVKGSSSSGEQNDIYIYDIEVLLSRSLPQPDETLSLQMEAVVRAAAAFRT